MLRESSFRARRNKLAQNVCLIGAIGSFIYSTPGTSESLRIDFFAVIRGALPIICYLISFLICPLSLVESKRKNGLPEFFLTLFILFSFLSLFWSFNPKGTLLKVINLCFTWLCVYRLPNFQQHQFQAFSLIFKIANLFVFAGILEFLLFPNLVYVQPSAFESKRLNVLVPQIGANLFGIVAFVSLVGIISGHVFGNQRYKVLRITFLICVVAMLVAAHSRLIFLTVILATYYFISKKIQETEFNSTLGLISRFSLFIASLFTLYLSLSSPAVQSAFASFFTRGQDTHGLTTLTGRTTVWNEALEFGNQRPLVGFGFYSGHRYALGSVSSVIRSHNNLDNTWIEAYIDVGLIGVLLLVLVLVGALIRFERQTAPYRRLTILVWMVIVSNSFYNPGITMPSSTLIFFAYFMSVCRKSADFQFSRAMNRRNNVV